jgi:hypothetical protein
MPELDDVDEEMAAEAARNIAAGTDHIWMPIEFVKDDIPPPKAPLPAISVQISRMTIMERVKVAILGGKDARMILAHDSNRVVRRYVLVNPRITDGEIAMIANSKLADEEILRIISEKREWMKNYQVRLGVIRNPKTPLVTAINLLPTLMLRDLGKLAKSRDVPEGVVHHARRIYLDRRDRGVSS